MRRAPIITSALVAVAALAAAPAAGTTGSKKATKLSCEIALFAQGAPSPSAMHFGKSTCPAPFGRGLHYDEYTVTPTTAGQGTVTGTFKNYYDRGTASGTVALTFAASSPTDITYTGTVTYTGGTAKFKHVRGGGTVQCTTTDGGAHKACTVHSALTGI